MEGMHALAALLAADIDWQEVGQGLALLLAGAGATWGVIKKWFPAASTADKPTTSIATPPVPVDLLPAVLEALDLAKDAADDAVGALRSANLTTIETQRSLGSVVGALREITERLEGVETRLRRATGRVEKTGEHQRQKPAPE